MAKRTDRELPRRRRRPSAEALEGRRLMAVITVNTVADVGGPGAISLRQAIEISNGTLGVSADRAALVTGGPSSPNTIDFAITGTGPFVIKPTSALPTITSPLIIDGYSQPGASPNANGPGLGDDAKILVEVDFTSAQVTSPGLTVDSVATIQGLAIGGYVAGASGPITDILFAAHGSGVLRGDFLGLDPSGTSPIVVSRESTDRGRGTETGSTVAIESALGVTIGGTDPASRNVISGYSDFLNGTGITVDDSALAAGSRPSTLIVGNFIGTDASGTRAVTNDVGIDLKYAVNVTVGGTTPEARNVISGDLDAGIITGPGSTSGSLIEGNYVGPDVTGTKGIGDSIGIVLGSQGDTVGGTASGAGNLISGNDSSGLQVFDPSVASSDGEGGPTTYLYAPSHGNLVQGNVIGLDSTGLKVLGNGGDGITIAGYDNTIGGTVAGARNVISGNYGNGVAIDGAIPDQTAGYGMAGYMGANTVGNVVQGNVIGLDAAGLSPIGNGMDGVLAGGTGSTIGGNVVAYNGGSGVAVATDVHDLEMPRSLPVGLTYGGQQVTISTNSIRDNAGLAIDLEAGTNAGLAAPSLYINERHFLSGTVAGTDPTGDTIEVFSAAGPGQATTYLGSTTIGSFQAGIISFEYDPSLVVGTYLTATATDAAGNTSALATSILAFPVEKTTTFASISSYQGNIALTGTVEADGYNANTGTVTLLEDGMPVPASLAMPQPATAPVDYGQPGFTFNLDGLSVGTHHFSVAYSGVVNAHDDSLAPSTSPVIDFTATPGTTTVQVLATVGGGLEQSAALGQPVTFYAIVLGTIPYTTMPKGSVTFSIDGVAQPPSPFGGYNNTHYSSSITVSDLSAGPHVITASYSGEAQLLPSPPADPITLVIDGASAVKLVAGPTPTLVGKPATFAATVVGVGSNGVVAFGAEGVLLGYAPVISGVAVFQTTKLTPGNHTVEAVYLGDSYRLAILGNFVQAYVSPTAVVDGPRVTGAQPYGSDGVGITFNRPIKPATARDPANYRIQGIGTTSPKVVSATLDANGSALVLRTNQKLDPRKSYRLTVHGSRLGGVVDVYGIALDGKKNGRPGSDSVTTIGKKPKA